MTNAQQRQRVVADFEQSGLSRRDYCAQHRLSVNTLDNWRRKARLTAKFVRVEVSPARSGGLTLVLTNGRRIETEAGFDEHELAVEAVDMRKGFDGLYGLVRDQLGGHPLSGYLFRLASRAASAAACGVGRSLNMGDSTIRLARFRGSVEVDGSVKSE
jgi:transposase-like protein